jgi:hypothetical protein
MLSNGGAVCLFVGYPSNHAYEAYQLLNPETNHATRSRDIICLLKLMVNGKNQRIILIELRKVCLTQKLKVVLREFNVTKGGTTEKVQILDNQKILS